MPTIFTCPVDPADGLVDVVTSAMVGGTLDRVFTLTCGHMCTGTVPTEAGVGVTIKTAAGANPTVGTPQVINPTFPAAQPTSTCTDGDLQAFLRKRPLS